MIISNTYLGIAIIIFLGQCLKLDSQTNYIQIEQKELCNKPAIDWVDEISPEKFLIKDEGFFSSVLNFILGEEELTIVRPFGSYVSDNGSIYYIDQDEKSLMFIDKKENEIRNILPDEIKLESPVGLCSTEDGLLISDSENDKVWKYYFENEEVSELNNSLKQPTGITYLKDRNEIWVCETKNHRIVRLDKNGNQIGTIGQRGIEPGEFNFPTFIWADNKGKVYINDSMNFRIQIFSEVGVLIKTFGKAGDGTGDFARPKGIATDSFGHIYVADALFNNIQVFNEQGQLLYTFGQKGIEKGEFWLPAGIYIDNVNKIYVADSYNSRIQIFQLSCDGEIEN